MDSWVDTLCHVISVEQAAMMRKRHAHRSLRHLHLEVQVPPYCGPLDRTVVRVLKSIELGGRVESPRSNMLLSGSMIGLGRGLAPMMSSNTGPTIDLGAHNRRGPS